MLCPVYSAKNLTKEVSTRIFSSVKVRPQSILPENERTESARLPYHLLRSLQVGLRRPERMKIGGEGSATCRGCAAFSTRPMTKPRNLGRLRYIFRFLKSLQVGLRRPERMKIGGEGNATCRGCDAFSTRPMTKPRNLGRLRYIFRGENHA